MANENIVHEATERKKTSNLDEPSFTFSQEVFLSLVQHLPIGIVCFEYESVALYNPVAEQLFSTLGYTPKKLWNLEELLKSVLDIREPLRYAHLYTKRLHLTNGELFILEFTIVSTPEPSVTFLILKDVTDLFTYRESIEEMDRLLVVGELAAGLAHEIRNPLASLRGFTQMIQRSKDPDSNLSYTQIMLNELDRINGLVEELLQLAKPRSQPFFQRNLIEILNSVVILLNPQAIVKSCAIHLSVENWDWQQNVLCQPNKLKQAFINLIKNAVEASEPGRIIDVIVKRTHKFVDIFIIDDGPGIDDSILHHLGKKFITTKESGTGLGLMLSQSIISDHMGQLEILKNEKRGTEVRIRLPVCQ